MGLHHAEPTIQGPLIGPLFETMVVSEWVKAFYHRGEKPELYYWRSKTGLEVDLVIDRNHRLYSLEVKTTATRLPGHIDNLIEWRRLAGDLATACAIIAKIDQPTVMRGCHAIPWYLPLDR